VIPELPATHDLAGFFRAIFLFLAVALFFIITW